MQSYSHRLAALLGWLAILASAGSGQSWIQLLPSGGGPTGSILYWARPTAVYDPSSNRLIVYLGVNQSLSGAPPSQLWVLTNANGLGGSPAWIQLYPTGTPPQSTTGLHSMVYDVAGNRAIMHGGCYSFCGWALANVHVLSNANGASGAPAWSEVSVTNPFSREAHSAVYDAPSNRMLTFGGGLAFYGTDQNDTRILTNANGAPSPSTWMAPAIVGSPPAARESHRLAYDQANNRMILFGGVQLPTPSSFVNYNDVWVLSDANGLGSPAWTQLTPAGGPPAARHHHSAVYDTAGNYLIVYGGTQRANAGDPGTVFGDVWRLRNANGLGGAPSWTQLSPSGPSPSARLAHTAAIDTANRRMIVFGGYNLFGEANGEVWILDLRLRVNIDIKPGSDPNCFRPNDGVIPVAILGSASFHVSEVDPATVQLDGLGVKVAGKSNKYLAHFEDVNRDGFLDLVVQIQDQDGAFISGTATGTLTGKLFDGTEFYGSDSICIVP